MISGVKIIKKSIIADDRGRIMHVLRSTDNLLKDFGELYCSTVYPKIVKGWHLHKFVTINYFVLSGSIKFVLFDNRKNSATKNQIQEIMMGDTNNVIVSVPPNVWNGFKGVGLKESYVLNIQDKPYDENEVSRLDPHDNALINYDWKTKDR